VTPLKRTCGIGLRTPHLPAFAAEDDTDPLAAPWLEIHTENFLCEGGPRRAMLEAVARRYPLSCHGVALSLGSADDIDANHLKQVKALTERLKPIFVSDHLSWSTVAGVHYNDLLPLPYDDATLDVVAMNVARVQDSLGRRILIENPSRYLAYNHATMDEATFLTRLVSRTGCGLLLDVNNVYVSAINLGLDAGAYLQRIPAEAVEEIHLAGHTTSCDQPDLLIDTHDRPVTDDVWALYRKALALIGPRPTLIEWDTAVPALPVLLREMAIAQALLSP